METNKSCFSKIISNINIDNGNIKITICNNKYSIGDIIELFEKTKQIILNYFNKKNHKLTLEQKKSINIFDFFINNLKQKNIYLQNQNLKFIQQKNINFKELINHYKKNKNIIPGFEEKDLKLLFDILSEIILESTNDENTKNILTIVKIFLDEKIFSDEKC